MYEELVKQLRNCTSDTVDDCAGCPYQGGYKGTYCMNGLITEAADAIEELQQTVEHYKWCADDWCKEACDYKGMLPRWISATERLPEEEESVLVVRKFLGIKGQVPPSTYTEIAYRICDVWLADSDEHKIARHKHTDPLYWMPLPEPPKEETEWLN